MESTRWETASEDFYGIDRPCDGRFCISILELIGDAQVATLRRTLEDHFAVDLAAMPRLGAQRYKPGSGIGPHTDSSDPEVRLVINLNRTWTDLEGGIWVLASDSSLASDRLFLPPSHDTGFAFATSDTSFHALTIRDSGISYAIIIAFEASTE